MAAVTELPEGVHHYETADEVPFEISKYWHQRYEIFSKYDEGIWMTDDAWFGVTPEPVATYADCSHCCCIRLYTNITTER